MAKAPLNGIRVIDLGWLTAGAATSTLLLDLGADVVKVEGPGALDPFRNWVGADPARPWWDESPWFAFTNRGKKSVCLDLKDPRGRDAMLALLATADVLVENYRRGVLDQWGLGAAELRAKFPRLIIASISSQGEDGPERDMVSFGSTLEATSGLAALTGEADGPPIISGRDVNYPDQVVCLFASGAVVAALMERARTGQGCHIDLSQRELTSFLLGEEFLAAAEGAPSPREGYGAGCSVDGDTAFWPGGSAPVRDARALSESAEFQSGTAVLRSPDGTPAKGIPFRFASRTLAVHDNTHALGADNHDVLLGAGLNAAAIATLEADGVLATKPRRGPTK